MRRNPMIRVRRYDQWAQEMHGWHFQCPDGSGFFADAVNPSFKRDRRMQSWRRPL